MHAVGRLNSSLGPSLILPPARCSPSLVFILWGIYCEVVFGYLLWSLVRIMLAYGVLIMIVDYFHVDMAFLQILFPEREGGLYHVDTVDRRYWQLPLSDRVVLRAPGHCRT